MAQSPSKQPALVAFDAGNTSVKCAALLGGQWTMLLREPTEPIETLARRLREAFPRPESEQWLQAHCAAASVRPSADAALAQAWEGIGRTPVRFLGRDVPVPLRTRVPRPDRVGVDRLLAALAAREQLGAPCTVVAAGTAVTVDLVDADGAFIGGAIMPGLGLAAEALHRRAALLPQVRVTEPPPLPGADTEGALRAGVYWSVAGGVVALLERYADALGEPRLPVAVTGTDAPLLMEALPPGARPLPHLVFQGMAIALERSGG